jgi:hypothetical protein
MSARDLIAALVALAMIALGVWFIVSATPATSALLGAIVAIGGGIFLGIALGDIIH